MFIHPSQGNARIVVRNFLDSMNKKEITYAELSDFMRSFQKCQETNFYLAAKHFFETTTNAQPTKSVVEITKITDAVKSLTTAFFR